MLPVAVGFLSSANTSSPTPRVKISATTHKATVSIETQNVLESGFETSCHTTNSITDTKKKAPPPAATSIDPKRLDGDLTPEERQCKVYNRRAWLALGGRLGRRALEVHSPILKQIPPVQYVVKLHISHLLRKDSGTDVLVPE